MHVTREDLQNLADTPIGDRSLQGANIQAHLTSAEALEAAKRATKLWLPLGRKPRVNTPKETKAAFKEQQIDIEDAIEQAGGKRGGTKAA